MSVHGVSQVARLEVRKLGAQLRITVLLWACALGPIALVGVLKLASTTPADTLFGRWVQVSGLATPLVVLGFAGQWVFPILASIVAGDVFASEDRFATWKIVLSRSRNRAEVFAGKCLAGLGFAVVSATLVLVGSTLAGLLLVGRDPMFNLSGTLVEARGGTGLVLLSGLSQAMPVLTFASMALMLSVVSRNSLVGVGGPVLVGLLMQLLALTDLPPVARMLLPSGAFASWHGLWLDDPVTAPIWAGAGSCLALTVMFLATAGMVFGRRDVVVR